MPDIWSREEGERSTYHKDTKSCLLLSDMFAFNPPPPPPITTRLTWKSSVPHWLMMEARQSERDHSFDISWPICTLQNNTVTSWTWPQLWHQLTYLHTTKQQQHSNIMNVITALTSANLSAPYKTTTATSWMWPQLWHQLTYLHHTKQHSKTSWRWPQLWHQLTYPHPTKHQQHSNIMKVTTALTSADLSAPYKTTQ